MKVVHTMKKEKEPTREELEQARSWVKDADGFYYLEMRPGDPSIKAGFELASKSWSRKITEAQPQ